MVWCGIGHSELCHLHSVDHYKPKQAIVKILLLLLLRSPARSLGFTILDGIFVYVTVFNPTVEVVTFPSLWMVHAGCGFVAGIHLSRT